MRQSRAKSGSERYRQKQELAREIKEACPLVKIISYERAKRSFPDACAIAEQLILDDGCSLMDAVFFTSGTELGFLVFPEHQQNDTKCYRPFDIRHFQST